jgi:hypothetical protein
MYCGRLAYQPHRTTNNLTSNISQALAKAFGLGSIEGVIELVFRGVSFYSTLSDLAVKYVPAHLAFEEDIVMWMRRSGLASPIHSGLIVDPVLLLADLSITSHLT